MNAVAAQAKCRVGIRTPCRRSRVTATTLNRRCAPRICLGRGVSGQQRWAHTIGFFNFSNRSREQQPSTRVRGSVCSSGNRAGQLTSDRRSDYRAGERDQVSSFALLMGDFVKFTMHCLNCCSDKLSLRISHATVRPDRSTSDNCVAAGKKLNGCHLWEIWSPYLLYSKVKLSGNAANKECMCCAVRDLLEHLVVHYLHVHTMCTCAS